MAEPKSKGPRLGGVRETLGVSFGTQILRGFVRQFTEKFMSTTRNIHASSLSGSIVVASPPLNELVNPKPHPAILYAFRIHFSRVIGEIS